MGLLEQSYEVPSGGESRFMRLDAGENRIRILDKPNMGYQYFEDNKCIKVAEKNQAADGVEDLKHFWDVPVWANGKVMILTITQKTIQNALASLDSSAEWANLNEYDVIITKSGQSLETKYQTTPCPKAAVKKEAKDAYAELCLDYKWKDVFSSTETATEDKQDDLPF
jgi:hypothetical protein|tara:strand:+ start:2307 stop:2810 length:504 start_codon:yes stop_codon:yes gene_type:complete